MGFSHRTPFTIATGQVPSSQSSFPALIKPTDARFKSRANGGHVDDPNGIRPYADIGLTSALTFQLVPGTYDSSTGTFEMWVNVTAADGLVIYLAYGDPSITSDGSSSSTWASAYKGVWHLNDGTTLSAVDSTSNGNNGTVNSVSAGAGQIDGCGSFSGSTSSYINKTDNGSADITGSISIAFWSKCNASSYSGFAGMLMKGDGSNNNFMVQTVNGDTAFQWHVSIGGSDESLQCASGTTITNWNHWVFTANSANGDFNVYRNGSLLTGGTRATGTINTNNSDIEIGRRSGQAGFNGLIDEVQLYAGLWTANYITTVYNNQSAPNTFWTMGAEASLGPTPGYQLGYHR